MKNLVTAFALLILSFPVLAQKHLFVAFYNQENLYDTIDDADHNDNEFLPSAKKEWNTEKYLNKINHMGHVISSMNDEKGPDVIGLCEVENKLVLRDLVLSKAMKPGEYDIVHLESPDDRGIDNALLFKGKEFRCISVIPYRVTFHENPDLKTRDILLVKLEAKNRTRIVFLVNHFPSRIGGQRESEPKRFRAATVLRHIYDSIIRVDPDQAVVIMGDFNDEPNNLSIDSVLASKGSETALQQAADLLNPMYALKMKGEGTLTYKGEWNLLDQIMVNKTLVDCSTNVCYKPGSAGIYKPAWMQETEEKYKGSPLRTFAGNKYLGGYSDHFPVFLLLSLKK